MRDVLEPKDYQAYLRDRAHSRKTFLSSFWNTGVTEGCPHQTYGLEAVKD